MIHRLFYPCSCYGHLSHGNTGTPLALHDLATSLARKGFVVVATDIRNLAHDSAENADHIKDLVKGIQDHPFQGVVPAPAAVTFAPQRENCGCGKKSWRGLRAMRR